MIKKFLDNLDKFLLLFSKQDIKEIHEQDSFMAQNAAEEVETPIDKNRKQEIENEVDFFIKSGKKEKIQEYLSAGYRFNLDQMILIAKEQPGWMSKERSYEAYHSRNNSTNELYQLFLENYSEQIKKIIDLGFKDFEKLNSVMLKGDFVELKNKSIEDMQDRFLQANDKLRIAGILLQNYITLFENDKTNFYRLQTQCDQILAASQKAISAHKRTHEVIEIRTIDWRQATNYTFFRDIQSNAQSIQRVLADNLDLATQNEHHQTLSDIKTLYSSGDPIDSIQSNLKNNLNKKISMLRKASFTPEAWLIIERIQKTGAQILPGVEKINPEDAFEVKSLTQKVLFDVISSYVAVLPEFKAHLKNEEGKNIEEIFIESLEHIDQQLQDKAKLVANAQFREVKVEHQYLKAKM